MSAIPDIEGFRIIDLSCEVFPGERRIDGTYLFGEPVWGRVLEAEEYVAYDARMHRVSGPTHLGTHTEATSKYAPEGPDLGTMPVESYLGEAVVCDFSLKRPREAIGPADLEQAGVRATDLVLLRGSERSEEELAYLSDDAIDWLIETRVKLVGWEHVLLSPPGTPYGDGAGDWKLLRAGIALVDGLVGLDRITRRRVFFISLPPRIRRVTAGWTRAIVLEPCERE